MKEVEFCLPPVPRTRVPEFYQEIPYYMEMAKREFEIVEAFPTDAWEPPSEIRSDSFHQTAPMDIIVIQLLFQGHPFALVLWRCMERNSLGCQKLLGDLPEGSSLTTDVLDEVKCTIDQGSLQTWLEQTRQYKGSCESKSTINTWQRHHRNLRDLSSWPESIQ